MQTATTAPANHPAQAPKILRVCQECGADFRTFRVDAVFCSRTCSTNWTNREKRRAVELYRLAMEHRRSRGRGHVQFGDITGLLDRFIAEDRERERGNGGLWEPKARKVREVMYKGKVVGTVEDVGGEWYWRAQAPGAKRDTSRRHRHSPASAVPARYLVNRKPVFAD